MNDLAISLAVVAATWLFTRSRLLRYLRYFQQDAYSARRFVRWLVRARAFDRRGTLILGATALVIAVAAAADVPRILQTLALGAGLVALVLLELSTPDPRRSGKLPLRMTPRARRIHGSASIACALLALLGAGLAELLTLSPRGAWLCAGAVLLAQALPWIVIAGNASLWPAEQRHQHRLRREAEARLAEVDSVVIGITGSYGKTSTKHMLGRLLGGPAAAFWPSGSVNTVMGITREVRERLSPRHRYAVFEVAAHAEGSIRRLCEFVRPQHGIVTNVGCMHLERFGSEEAIRRAKGELAEALPAGGVLVLNHDDEGARSLAARAPQAEVLFYGLAPHGQHGSFASAVEWTESGARFLIHWNGRTHAARTRLLGRPMLANVLAAFTLAARLGADIDYLLAAIANLEPEANRLKVEQSGEITILNDAHNSNPVGFASALEVLAQLRAKRRILVTPGMIELGPRQHAENERAGLLASGICDLVLVVGETNRRALLDGLARSDRSVEVRTFAGRDDALKTLRTLAAPGDAVLVENDLPDLYEQAGVF